jgi:uncharacterized membrane protein YfcA
VGVVVGFFAMNRLDERQARLLIGGIVVGLVLLHVLRRWRGGRRDDTEHGWWFAPAIGVLAGFTTLVANAAGPLMVIYLLAMRLPKMEYMGTGAVFFMLMNWFKIPFMVKLGLISPTTFALNLWLAPAVFLAPGSGGKSSCG